ncbi:MAG: ribonuclease R [Acholeplasmataceae bacterium]|nr:ribonuclease R [Acholeplasmataceae bacterium]
MKELYLAFYDAKTRQLHIDDSPGAEAIDTPYVSYHAPYLSLKSDYLIGRLDHKRTFGFLRQETGDIYIDGPGLGDAMHDDIVIVKDGGDPLVVEIVKRALTHVIGTVTIIEQSKVFENDQHGFTIVADVPADLAEGHVARLSVTAIADGVIHAAFDSVIGHVNDPDIETLKIVYGYDWPRAFSKETMDGLANARVDLANALKTRRDLRSLMLVTIDGKDAKDLDDAISLSYENGKYQLGVHIADVSHYVKEGSPLDQDAYERATSVYLADRVIPMLPHLLSNDLCSLNAKTPKLALSCLMTLDDLGKVTNYEIVSSVIESKRRLTYDEVNRFLKEQKPLGNKALESMLLNMATLSSLLQDIRSKRGEIAFESVELGFKVDKDGRVLDVYERTTDVAERLIESLMLIANETVARHMHDAGLPSLYRVHEKPDVEKLKNALSTIQKLGFPVSLKHLGGPKPLQKATSLSSGTPYVSIVHMLLLRAMQKAKYSHKDDIHFGLGARHYTHFTSPIRRYPDLMLHRLIHLFVLGESHDVLADMRHFEETLPDVAHHTSDQERKAIDMERDVDKLKSAEYMQTKLNQRYQGIITQMMPSGMFVRIDNGIEGFVALRTMNDYYRYDEMKLRYVGNRGKAYRLGDRVEIEVSNVDMMSRKIDFIMVGRVRKREKRS